MRLIVLFVASVLGLSGCSAMGLGLPKTPGAFIEAPGGDTFSPMETLDPRNAMVYIYRPVTQWGYEEVQAPSFFMDSSQLFGLKAGAYEWLELHPGRYDFYARRPLSVLYLKMIFELPLEVEGGQEYYFRYSETRPLDLQERVKNPEQYQTAGPLQQVPRNLALREIADLRLDEPGQYYGGEKPLQPRWAPFYTYGEVGAQKTAASQDEASSSGLLARAGSWFAGLF